MFSDLTIASYAFTRPTVSSDFTVSISWRVYAAPYASSAQTSISPKRWPPNCALPPSGCWVTSEYGPVDRAWILSSTRWSSFRMYMLPTVTRPSYGSPVRPLYSRAVPNAWVPSRLRISTDRSMPRSPWSSCQRTSAWSTSSTVAPSNTGDATYTRPPFRWASL